MTDTVPASGFDAETLLRLAASADRSSEHPLAQAIVDGARNQGLDLAEPSEFEAVPGHGVETKVKGRQVLVGDARLMQRHHVGISAVENDVERLQGEGKTAMLVAVDGRAAGVVAVADTIKEDSVEAIRVMQGMGLKVVMITGDNERTARASARQVGIERVDFPRFRRQCDKIQAQPGKETLSGEVRRTYIREFKIEAVRLLQTGEITTEELARDLGVSRSSLNRWHREYESDTAQTFPENGKRKERDEEVEQLKRELRVVQQERENLGAATAMPTPPWRASLPP